MYSQEAQTQLGSHGTFLKKKGLSEPCGGEDGREVRRAVQAEGPAGSGHRAQPGCGENAKPLDKPLV